mmetsp:Transcript_13065/g.40244  ORF Transcript_13065/g.40244 Transcript_13065/m.40244 type:complete len:258 (-) Transcript_13065:72-845(-)
MSQGPARPPHVICDPRQIVNPARVTAEATAKRAADDAARQDSLAGKRRRKRGKRGGAAFFDQFKDKPVESCSDHVVGVVPEGAVLRSVLCGIGIQAFPQIVDGELVVEGLAKFLTEQGATDVDAAAAEIFAWVAAKSEKGYECGITWSSQFALEIAGSQVTPASIEKDLKENAAYAKIPLSIKKAFGVTLLTAAGIFAVNFEGFRSRVAERSFKREAQQTRAELEASIAEQTMDRTDNVQAKPEDLDRGQNLLDKYL